MEKQEIELIRSALQIAKRKGAETNWDGFEMQCKKLLDLAHQENQEKDNYVFRETDDVSEIYKNNVQICTINKGEGEWTCHVLNNIDNMVFQASNTCIYLYLDGRKIGEMKTNYPIAKMFVEKVSKVFKSPPPQKFVDMSDIGDEYL